jgi:hypothetical protein
MSWEFLHLFRRAWQSRDPWGTLYMSDGKGNWERLSYTFERPWFTDEKGLSQKTYITHGLRHPGSRITEGLFELEERSDGAKGWRLQLIGTGPRTEIQIHRAHKSLYIEGCILPVSFMDFCEQSPDGALVRVIKKGDQQITDASLTIMRRMRDRYHSLVKQHPKRDDRATILVAAYLPPYYRSRPATTAVA